MDHAPCHQVLHGRTVGGHVRGGQVGGEGCGAAPLLHHHKRVRAQVRLEGELVGKVYCNTVLDATWSHDGQGVGDGEMGVGHRGGGTGG
jgi:hypothetical protein